MIFEAISCEKTNRLVLKYALSLFYWTVLYALVPPYCSQVVVLFYRSQGTDRYTTVIPILIFPTPLTSQTETSALPHCLPASPVIYHFITNVYLYLF